MNIINRQQLNANTRIDLPAELFGHNFPLRLEPYVYSITGSIAPEYRGGYWEFYTLSNGGFYMSPISASAYSVSCDNGFQGVLSPDALGIAACLYAYSHLSFAEGDFAENCAQHYHLLRDYMLEHAEARGIFGAID